MKSAAVLLTELKLILENPTMKLNPEILHANG